LPALKIGSFTYIWIGSYAHLSLDVRIDKIFWILRACKLRNISPKGHRASSHLGAASLSIQKANFYPLSFLMPYGIEPKGGEQNTNMIKEGGFVPLIGALRRT
jgi:hypothetical protein